ncbi:DUF3488 and transglutaminase-like domain-containing protein [Actinokineospora bangkokensis]|uniref:Transglutaminase-like domain-containing protein n=1 Tax=Actinokineospora bangkokensis TaxID=1193682 RepID=A0A1Q9LTT8_9PSEU|nr:transglutaminase domain-containing protein [Actinokineospora bangkokensis]OLR95455.1 hypothetical protein BJP25_06850 [Actinokineospora bangkokensis]
MTPLRTLWVVVLLGVAVVPLSTGWSGSLAWGVFAGAIALAALVVLLARRVGVGGEAVLAVGVVGALLGGYFVARGAIGGGPLEVLRDSVPRLLTAARPAPPTADLLMPGAVLVFCVALVVGVSLAGKSRTLVGPPIGAVVLYLAGALLTAGAADPFGLVAVAVVVVAAAGWVVLDRVEGEGVARAPVGPSAAVLSALAAVALVAGLLPARDPFEPRELVRPPVVELTVSNPLPRLSAWAAQGGTELLRVTGPQLPIRIVALSDFTGSTWRASSLYSPLGTVAEPDLPVGKRTATVEVRVSVGALQGTWLPAVGRPLSTSIGDALVDTDSGSLALARGISPGLTYAMTGVVDRPEDAALEDATVPSGPEAQRYTALPGLPVQLAQYARAAVRNARSPYEQAVALEQVVRLNRTPDAQAPAGSSYARVEQFLFGPPGEVGAGKGTAEQFATSYAVLARAVGLPTRVVVGFHPVPEEADGTRVLRGVDATAWPEVYFDDLGWVPFDPVSGTDSGPSAAAKREVLNRLASTTAAPSTPAQAGPPIILPPPAPPAAAAPEQPSRAWIAFAIGAPVLLLLLLLGLRAARRARWRRSGAAGAWAEVLDSLVLAGRSPARSTTAPALAESLPGPARRLAAMADWEAFAPGTARAPDEAWGLARQVRAALGRGVPWYRRVLWSVDPRPLWRK